MTFARLAVILSLVLAAIGTPVLAAGKQQGLAVQPQYFHDLPGVQRNPDNSGKSYACETVIRQQDRIGDIDFLGSSGMPVLAYRCERDGYVYEGTSPPNTGGWFPGINPHHLPD